MEHNPINIQMLGEFTLSMGDEVVSDNDNRSRKVWLVLAYLVYFRNRGTTTQELIERFWDDEGNSADPINALKAVLYRVRGLLDNLGEGIGKSLILFSKGRYTWNTEENFTVDIDEFERLRELFLREQDQETRISYGMQALALYHGDFLEKFDSDPWVMPISSYFHQSYVQLVESCLQQLWELSRYEDIVTVARQAIDIEPGEESIYSYLMRALLELDRFQAARSVYESMTAQLSEMGVTPSEELYALYRETMQTSNELEMDLPSLMSDLKEMERSGGAYYCEYDFFKVLCHVKTRSLPRSSETVHMCLMSVCAGAGKTLSKRSMVLCMQNLFHIIIASLRKGDLVAKCSPSQYIIMLSNANYENSCMVMERLERTFAKRYPHSPAMLRHDILPLHSSN